MTLLSDVNYSWLGPQMVGFLVAKVLVRIHVLKSPRLL